MGGLQTSYADLVRLRVQHTGPDVQLVAEWRRPQLPPVLALAVSNSGGELTLLLGPKNITLLAVTGHHRVVPFVEGGSSAIGSSGSGSGGSGSGGSGSGGSGSSGSGSSSSAAYPASPRGGQLASLGRFLRLTSSEPSDWRFHRVAFLPPQPPPRPGQEEMEDDSTRQGLAMLAPLQGLWAALYSVHGWEVLQVSVAADGASQPPPPDCPISGPRLEGLKLLGDPNVPAGR